MKLMHAPLGRSDYVPFSLTQDFFFERLSVNVISTYVKNFCIIIRIIPFALTAANLMSMITNPLTYSSGSLRVPLESFVFPIINMFMTLCDPLFRQYDHFEVFSFKLKLSFENLFGVVANNNLVFPAFYRYTYRFSHFNYKARMNSLIFFMSIISRVLLYKVIQPYLLCQLHVSNFLNKNSMYSLPLSRFFLDRKVKRVTPYGSRLRPPQIIPTLFTYFSNLYTIYHNITHYPSWLTSQVTSAQVTHVVLPILFHSISFSALPCPLPDSGYPLSHSPACNQALGLLGHLVRCSYFLSVVCFDFFLNICYAIRLAAFYNMYSLLFILIYEG